MRKRYHTIKEKQFERMKRDENNRIFVEKTVSVVKMPPTYTKPFPHTGILYAAAKHFPCILIFILSLSMSGCAAFSKKEFRRDYVKIPKNDISLLNGTYKIYPTEKYGEQTPFSAADSLKRNYNLYNTITGKTVMDKDTVQDVIDQYTVNITVTDRKEIKIYLMREGHVLDERTIRGKLQDGMFRLNNSFLSCHGIPYIFGGCHNIKRRLALSADGHLIVTEAVDNTGAILLFIGAGYSYNTAHRYERVE